MVAATVPPHMSPPKGHAGERGASRRPRAAGREPQGASRRARVVPPLPHQHQHHTHLPSKRTRRKETDESFPSPFPTAASTARIATAEQRRRRAQERGGGGGRGGGVLRGVPGAGRLRRLHAFPRDSGGAFTRVTATVANRLPWCEIAPQVAEYIRLIDCTASRLI